MSGLVDFRGVGCYVDCGNGESFCGVYEVFLWIGIFLRCM